MYRFGFYMQLSVLAASAGRQEKLDILYALSGVFFCVAVLPGVEFIRKQLAETRN